MIGYVQYAFTECPKLWECSPPIFVLLIFELDDPKNSIYFKFF